LILDANLLLYACNSSDLRQAKAQAFLEQVLNGPRRVGLPWQSLTAFARIATHPRVFPAPLSPAAASDQVEAWLAAPAA
jgi:predicted nucleic acid-binding protein